jgi:hypothetical protein
MWLNFWLICFATYELFPGLRVYNRIYQLGGRQRRNPPAIVKTLVPLRITACAWKNQRIVFSFFVDAGRQIPFLDR